MKPVRLGTIDCPDCGSAAVLRIWIERFAAFRCPSCGCKGFGGVKKAPKSTRQPDDIVVHMREDKP
jgi:predicted RNA-binding Zn-ribbon protein involved in translation (DUF1610 family)